MRSDLPIFCFDVMCMLRQLVIQGDLESEDDMPQLNWRPAAYVLILRGSSGPSSTAEYSLLADLTYIDIARQGRMLIIWYPERFV